MTIEADLDPSGDVSDYLNWALESGLWDGRQVSWMQASDFREEVQKRIFEMLFENPDDQIFEHLAAQLAWIGTSSPCQTLLARDIQELDFSKNSLILQASCKKSLSKFWKKHKKEILIGVGILVVVTVVVVISASTAGAGAGAAAAGGAALGGKKDRSPKQPSSASPTPQTPPSVSLQIPDPTAAQLAFGETGIAFNGQYTSYSNILLNQTEPTLLQPYRPPECASPEKPSPIPAPVYQPPFFWQMHPLPRSPYPNQLESAFSIPLLPETGAPKADISLETGSSVVQNKPWLSDFLEAIGTSIPASPDLLDWDAPLPSPEASCVFSTLGTKDPSLGISIINGINTTMEEAVAHANYIAQFAQGRSVEGIYNRSHGAAIDLAEVFICNYPGYSPNTAKLLQDRWSSFHLSNLANPDVKFLQICHSQGAIHVRNALANLPREIQNRVIVVAIAPAAIIPKELCFDSFNYASKKDIIPYGELLHAGAFDTNEYSTSPRLEMIIELRKELILLDPHPDATDIDHSIESPTFLDAIEDHVKTHINNNGAYK